MHGESGDGKVPENIDFRIFQFIGVVGENLECRELVLQGLRALLPLIGGPVVKFVIALIHERFNCSFVLILYPIKPLDNGVLDVVL